MCATLQQIGNAWKHQLTLPDVLATGVSLNEYVHIQLLSCVFSVSWMFFFLSSLQPNISTCLDQLLKPERFFFFLLLHTLRATALHVPAGSNAPSIHTTLSTINLSVRPCIHPYNPFI